MPSLGELIEARIEQAEDGRIRKKAAVVARHLGSYDSWNKPGEGGHNALYEQGSLRIEDSSFFEDGGDGIVAGAGSSITYRGKVVFVEGGSTICSYIPGSWEGILDELYDRAEIIANEEHAERRREIARKKGESGDQERLKWGL